MQFGRIFKKKAVLIAAVMSVCFLLFGMVGTACARIIYVDANAPGADDGTNWENAYNNLQDALADANSSAKPLEIRVAQGIYKPDEGLDKTSGDRTVSFQLINGVSIYGGFPSGGGEWEDREPNAHETTLSGDLNEDDDPNYFPHDNSYHVVTSSCTDPNTILDGFIITAGCADGHPEWFGGGMFCDEANLTIKRCNFIKNRSSHRGGGIYNDKGNIEIIDCFFAENTAIGDGGGLYNNEGQVNLINSSFCNNRISYGHSKGGGGMCNVAGTATLINCTFSDNRSIKGGGGLSIWGGSIIIKGCTFSNNKARSYSGTTYEGGGIYCSDVSLTLTDCLFIGNKGLKGGGLYGYDAAASLTKCIFRDNETTGYLASGGGLYITGYGATEPILTNCIFINNSTSGHGGGVGLPGTQGTFINCYFRGNSALGNGGGMNGGGILNNCIFVGNTSQSDGGGIYNSHNCDTLASHCIFSGNAALDYGGAVCCFGADIMIINCILWDNESMNGPEIAALLLEPLIPPLVMLKTNPLELDTPPFQPIPIPSSAIVNYSNIQGGETEIHLDTDCTLNWDQGNIDVNPLFVEPGYWDANGIWVDGDYRLLPDSPCIDTGDPNYVAGPNETDLDGNPRVADGDGDGIAVVDMGAYEALGPYVSCCFGVNHLKIDAAHLKCKGITLLEVTSDQGVFVYTPDPGKDKLKKETIVDDGVNGPVKIHTSGSKPLEIGDVFGPYTVTNVVKIYDSRPKKKKKGDDIDVKGTLNPSIPINLRTDEVTYVIDDGKGHTLDFTIPAGLFRPDGRKCEDRKFKFKSPKGSYPELDARFDFAQCKFELKVKRTYDLRDLAGRTFTVALFAGTNLGEETVQVKLKGHHLEHKKKPKMDCCRE